MFIESECKVDFLLNFIYCSQSVVCSQEFYHALAARTCSRFVTVVSFSCKVATYSSCFPFSKFPNYNTTSRCPGMEALQYVEPESEKSDYLIEDSTKVDFIPLRIAIF